MDEGRLARAQPVLVAIGFCVLIVLAVLVIGFGFQQHHIDQNTDQIVKATQKAQEAESLASQIDARLKAQKVCSETNQGDACRALFDRLALNLSAEQRFRLACDVLGALRQEGVVRELRYLNACPPPLGRSTPTAAP